MGWLYLYTRKVAERQLRGNVDWEEMASRLSERWLLGLDEFVGRVDLNQSPLSYLLRYTWWRLQHVVQQARRVTEIDGEVVREIRSIFPTMNMVQPSTISMIKEAREMVARIILHSALTFRFRRWRQLYLWLAEEWVKTGEEIELPAIPTSVRDAMLYHLRTAVHRSALKIAQ